MSLLVQKYGGTSVGNPERIRNVACQVGRQPATERQTMGGQYLDAGGRPLLSAHRCFTCQHIAHRVNSIRSIL